ncbi:cytochrome P450 [Melanogaster broomeanus]|nr:cytochrome P450 [Melanogaster broomeanus]
MATANWTALCVVVLVCVTLAESDVDEARSKHHVPRVHCRQVPHRYLLWGIFGVNFNTAFMAYGDRWRLQRRFFHQTLKADSATRFVPMQQSKAHELLRGLLVSPRTPISITCSIIMKSVYDYDTLSTNDHMVHIIGRVLTLALAVLTPDVTAVLEAFPIKNGERIITKGTVLITIRRMTEVPLRLWYSMRSENTEEQEAAPGWLQGLKEAASTAFADHIQLGQIQSKRRHIAQIEAVVGKGRLPTLDDRPSLTYIDAIMRETLRWNPIAPICQCRTTNPNIRKPFEFIPERFLNPDGTLTSDNVLNIAFGHGRRICAGRHFADTTLWFAISMILALFKVSIPKDEDGKEVAFEPEWTLGITRQPLPFPCNIVPRIPEMDANKLEQLINANA